MSTAAVPTSSIHLDLHSYFLQRNSDLKQLGHALHSGDLTGAQQLFGAIHNLGENGPFANGDAFVVNQRQHDFDTIGQALQSGDLAGAQQAFGQLMNTFHRHHQIIDPSPAAVVNLSGAPPASSGTASNSDAQPTPNSTAPASGPEIVLNLGNFTPGEQITIGVSNAGNGIEQVTIGLASQQNQSPEQITLNLNQNSNQEIILNLFNSTPSSAEQGSGVSVTA